jgi:hypothetical protein
MTKKLSVVSPTFGLPFACALVILNFGFPTADCVDERVFLANIAKNACRRWEGNMNSHSAAFVITSLLLLLTVDLTPARGSPTIVTEDIRVPSGEPGIDIYVRNEHPANITRFAPGRTLLYVHGATYPASETFDLKLGGASFMDLLASHGFDVYAMDLPGYGKSSRPIQ